MWCRTDILASCDSALLLFVIHQLFWLTLAIWMQGVLECTHTWFDRGQRHWVKSQRLYEVRMIYFLALVCLHATIVTFALPCSLLTLVMNLMFPSQLSNHDSSLSAVQLGWWQSVSKGIVQLSRNLLFSCSLDHFTSGSHPVICIMHRNDCDRVAWHHFDELITNENGCMIDGSRVDIVFKCKLY